METDEDMFKATPQLSGSSAHNATNGKTSSTRRNDIMALPVYSEELGVAGIIDIYKGDQLLLIERKNNLKHVYRGQLYQLWAQYFCMVEMGYRVEHIAFYEISTNKMLYQHLPTAENKRELVAFIKEFRSFKPEEYTHFIVNPNKCRHCIYCNLCDKAIEDNVYT